VPSSLSITIRRMLGRNPYGRSDPMALAQNLLQYALSSAELVAVLYLPGYARLLRRNFAAPLDFMVVGAQKAGTTWLHAQIMGLDLANTSEEKECHHFDLGRKTHLRAYARQFRMAAAGRLTGEVAPDYGPISPWRIRAIAKLFTGLKVIFVARNPVERAWSAAKMETAFVNQRPLDTIPVRMLVGYLLSPRSLKHSDFAQIVRNWAEAVGPERTRVLFYDQLVADPADFLRDFARFTYGGDAAPILAKIDAAARAGGFRSRVFPGDDAPPSRPVALQLRRVYQPLAERFLALAPTFADPAVAAAAREAWMATADTYLSGAATRRVLFVSGFSPNPASTSAGQKLSYIEIQRLRALGAEVDVVAFLNDLDALDPPAPPDAFGRPPVLIGLDRKTRLKAALRRPDLPLFASARLLSAGQALKATLDDPAYTDFYADFTQGLAAVPQAAWPLFEFRQHDIVSKLYRRQAASGSGAAKAFFALEAARAERWENRAWSRVARLTTLALDDPEIIMRRAPGSRPVVAPLSATFDLSGVARSEATIQPGRIVFWGNMARFENIDAVRWIVADILPRVLRARPHVQLYVVGAHPPPEIEALGGDGVVVTGFVDDPGEILATAEAAIAPLRFGSGVKLKVLETVGAGIPTVTTAVGAEGLPGSDRLFVEEGAQGLADRLVDLVAPEGEPRLRPAYADVS